MSASAAADPVVETVHAADGTPLRQLTWRPPAGRDARPAGALLLVHGVGEHAGRYAHVAAALVGLGLVVRGYDQRGFGASGGARATLPHPDALLDDVRDRYGALAREVEGAAPFVLGHSMGGCLVARAVTGGWIASPRAMILSSPGLVPRVNAVQRLAARLGARVAPTLRVPHGLPLDRLSHDPAIARAVRSDPLAHDRVTPRLVTFMLDEGPRAIADAATCRVPTLLQVAGDDRLVDPAGARAFFERLPTGVGTWREYPGLYHEVYNEREPDRGRVIEDLVAWASEVLGVGHKYRS